VWVYKGTVYSTKGTTWLGSPLWKKAQREVRQHLSIYSYISAYIQAQYMYCPGLLEYIWLVWPPTRDVGRCPQGIIRLHTSKRYHHAITEAVWSSARLLLIKRGIRWPHTGSVHTRHTQSTGCSITLCSKQIFWQIFSIILLFHNSKPRKWFLMIGKRSSLRTNRYCRRQQWRPSLSAVWARGNFAATWPNFGSPQLPNGLLQSTHFLVSRSVALWLQYMPGVVIQWV
jgi:hypothetical protein